jgi:cysteine-rich repeat protein
MSTEDFRQYKALVFGVTVHYPDSQPDWSGIEASRSAWSPAVEGNVAVLGAYEYDYFNLTQAAGTLISNGLDFVAGEPNKTGLYFSLGETYLFMWSESQVSALDGIGTFKVVGAERLSFNVNSHVVAAHPITVGLTDADLFFTYEAFTLYPSSFRPVTIARNWGEDWAPLPITNFSDGTRGIPYILVRGGFGATCGNGILEVGEECEDGNALDGDGCSQYCRVEVCGDGLVGQGEECDTGGPNAYDLWYGCPEHLSYPCNCSDCKIQSCGDGFKWEAYEECDDGNTVDFDGCSSNCEVEYEYCGDGVVQPGEECDDSSPRCVNCKLVEPCGNGVLQPIAGEECDDGNRVDGDGCSSACKVECKATSLPCYGVSQCCAPANKVCEGPTPQSQTCQVCKAVGTSCARYTQCCSSANKVCEGPAGKPKSCKVCLSIGKSCGRFTQCCSSANKVCEGPAGKPKTCQVCKAVGTSCARSTQCCSPSNKVCEGPVGKPKTCQVCKTRNTVCARSTQCCAGLSCKNRKCRP